MEAAPIDLPSMHSAEPAAGDTLDQLSATARRRFEKANVKSLEEICSSALIVNIIYQLFGIGKSAVEPELGLMQPAKQVFMVALQVCMQFPHAAV